MKPVIAIISALSVLILEGCGAVGVLEDENVDLRDKVDSLATVQNSMKQRVTYLEQENTKLDARNKQLNERIKETGALVPPEYTITEDRPSMAPPVMSVPLQPGAYVQPGRPIDVQTVPPPGGGRGFAQQSIPPVPLAEPWRAEQSALQSGAATGQPQTGNWSYKSQGGEPTQTGYTYKQPAQTGYTYKDPAQTGYTYKDPVQGGYQYKAPSQSAGQAGFDYNDSHRGEYNSAYSRRFDDRQPSDNAWQNKREAEQHAQQSLQQPVRPMAPPVQSPPVMRTPPVQTQIVQPQRALAIPVPPDQVDVGRAEAARRADYSYLAVYQKGLDAYQGGNYSEAIGILAGLASSAGVNNTSDNCDFWIAESYYAIQDYATARVYYSRVLSYPSSDKAADARARLNRIR